MTKIEAVETNTNILVNTVANGLSNTMCFEGDYSTTPFTLGYKYDRLYRFSEQYLKSQTGEVSSITSGRLQYRNWAINYGLSGTFNVDVVAVDDAPYETTDGSVMSSAVVGINTFGVGSASLAEGQIRTGVHSKSDKVRVQITSDSHLPFTIVSAVWEGRYTTRNNRVR